jgi:zinc/manganese transport system substrate-binding protein
VVRARAIATALAVALAGVAMTGCGDGDASDASTGGTRVVATTSILGAIADAVARPCGATTATLMPAGVDPHGFAPSARDVQSLREADLLVTNGGDLEESLVDAIDEASDSGTTVFEALGHARPLPLDEDDEHGGLDPHFWHDPVRGAAVVRALGEALAREDPPRTRCYLDEARLYAQELEALDAEIATTLDAVPDDRRLLVTSHDSFRYFADRYDFAIVGAVIPSVSSLADASAGDLGQLAQLIEERDVPAIFTDPAESDVLAQRLADETDADVEVVPLHSDSLGDDAPAGGEDAYEALLRQNAEAIAGALG